MALKITAKYQLKEEYHYDDGEYTSIYSQEGVTCHVFYTYQNDENTTSEVLVMTNITSDYINGKFIVHLENETHEDSYWKDVTNFSIASINNLQLQYMKYTLELGHAKIYNASLTSYKTIYYDTLNYDGIPYNHDCVNHSNLVAKDDFYNQNPFSRGIFNIDGNIGGNGKNIDLSFTAFPRDSGETSDDYRLNGNFDPDVQNRKNYQRGEIYRFAIQFMDNLGRKSHPKWMLDCKMPEHTDENYGNYVWQHEGVIKYSFLYPQIRVKNIPKNPDGTYMKWRVLQVKREEQDKTIIGTGLVAPTIKSTMWEPDGNPEPELNYCAVSLPSVKSLRGAYHLDMFVDDVPNVMGSKYPTDRTLMEVISPDIQFNKTDISSCIIQVVGTLDNTSTYWYRLGKFGSDDSTTWFGNYYSPITDPPPWNHIQRVKKLSRFLKLNTPLTQLRSPIETSKIVSPSAFNTSIYDIKGKTYKNVCYADEFHKVKSSHGTCTIAKIKDEDVMWLTGDGGLTSYLFATIKRDTIPYGGNSYIARFNNKYIPASPFCTDTSIHNVEYGDTYIGMFDYMRSQYNKDEADGYPKSVQEILYIPCETQINLALRNDTSFSKIADSEIKTNYKLTEDGLVDVDTGAEISKLYQYNSVYSRQNDAEIYTPLSYDSNDNYEYDTRVRRSQIKFNSEYSDSWLKFLQNDYIDLDSQYGELIDLKVNKNKLLFFQPNGFGILPVGEKELLSTKDTTTLALGTGGILNRFDYISDSIGIPNKEALISTPNALYIYSDKLNTLYRYDQNLISLTDSLGMNSWFDNYIDISKNVLFGYNPLMSELLFQFPIRDGNVEVLVYNEMTNSFVYFYPHEFVDSHKFSDFITMNQFLYSFSNATGNYKGYKHNFSFERNTIHTVQGISSLDIIVAPRKGNSVTFNVLEFLTNLTNINTNDDVNVTANKVLISNNTQSTGLIDLIVGNNVKKRFETWRFAKLRDNTPGLNRPHIKGEYIKIHLEFGSESDPLLYRKLIIKNIITDFSFSNVVY